MPNLIIVGGSFTPPGRHHVEIARDLRTKIARAEDRVVVRPCGDRPDKPTTNHVPVVHRAVMASLAFGCIPEVEVDVSDLDGTTFTRTFDLDQCLRIEHPDWRVMHVVGSDLVIGGAKGQSEIQTTWYRGKELWQHAWFLVIPRDGFPITDEDLPPNSRRIDIGISGSSTLIRDTAMAGGDISHLVPPAIADHIKHHGLFRGLGRPLIVADETRDRTAGLLEAVERVYAYRQNEPLTHIIVIGGDGKMLHAIREHSDKCLPFVGLNAGTEGFLLNNGTPEQLEERLRRGALRLYRQPTLVAEVDQIDTPLFAFNEFFLQPAGNQSVWLRVTINGVTRFERLMGDGLMISTAAGSTGWARSYGAVPIMIGTPMLLITGIGTLVDNRPWNWAHIGLNATIEVDVLDPVKRPVRLDVDGQEGFTFHHATINTNRNGSVTLGFFPETDLAEKISRLHFPGRYT